MLSVGTADELRWMIAEAAAGLLERAGEDMLLLVGAITPTAPGTIEDGCGWVLTRYSGTVAEVEAIERAYAIVRRRCLIVGTPAPRSFEPD